MAGISLEGRLHTAVSGDTLNKWEHCEEWEQHHHVLVRSLICSRRCRLYHYTVAIPIIKIINTFVNQLKYHNFKHSVCNVIHCRNLLFLVHESNARFPRKKSAMQKFLKKKITQMRVKIPMYNLLLNLLYIYR